MRNQIIINYENQIIIIMIILIMKIHNYNQLLINYIINY